MLGLDISTAKGGDFKRSGVNFFERHLPLCSSVVTGCKTKEICLSVDACVVFRNDDPTTRQLQHQYKSPSGCIKCNIPMVSKLYSCSYMHYVEHELINSGF